MYDFLSSSPRFDNRNGNEGMISVLDFLFYPKVGMLQDAEMEFGDVFLE